MSELNVVFFASLRESVGVSSYQIDVTLPITIKNLKACLIKELDHGEVLSAPGIQSSINYNFARENDEICEATDEVAFFPPVTGG